MVVAVLEHNGFRVVVPKQDCCGLPLQSNGVFDDARKVRAAAGASRWRRTAGDGYDHRRQRDQLHG